jgi:cytochrome c-type biogenesis protein CcmH
LLLAGAAASDRQQFALAADYWARLLAQIEPGSPKPSTRSAIERARAIAAQRCGGCARRQDRRRRRQRSQRRSDAERQARRPGQSGRRAVRLCPRRGRSAHAARRDPRDGRRPAAALPLRRLDGACRRQENLRLSSVSVEARIAKAGKAQSSSGDLFGTLTGVKPGSQGLRLLIDQVQP